MKVEVAIAAVALTLAGCASPETVLVVTVTAPPSLPDVDQLRVLLSTEDYDTSVNVFIPSEPTIDFPATFAVVLPRKFNLVVDLAIEGLQVDQAGSTTVANGSGHANVTPGRRADVSVALKSGASTCGNGSIDPGEDCDEGDRFSGDGCDFECHDELGGSDAGATDGSSGEGGDAGGDRATDGSADKASDGGDAAKG